MNCSEDDQSAVSAIFEDIENGKFLPLQRSKENASIPKQVHEAELNAILNNAESYLPFLKEKDAEGISVREKICSVFRFRIPYYVGPLSDRHKSQGANQWIKRKKEGYIYPWNFSEMVDEQASNEEFIQRMTNKCTYLVGEDVLPKNSLLYTKFMVLNELNNLRITGEVFTVIQALWETNDNLMQILSSDYTFMDEINTLNEKNMDEITHISYEDLVQPLYVSPSVKRAIWQTIQITEELRKVQKGAPEKIFVEMARGEEKEKNHM